MKTTKMSAILVLRSELFRRVALVLVLGLMVWLAEVSQAAPMGTAWTYQGRLIDANSAADGEYEFEFKLFDDPCTGTQQGSTIDVNEVTVNDGYFTAKLGFGTEVFDGNDVWLQIAVRPGKSTDAYTILTPRQQITPTPYALYAADSPDSDTLAELSCEDGQVPKWNGTMWVCGEDNVRSQPDFGTWTVTRGIDTNQVFRGIVEQIAAGGSVDGSLVYLNDNDNEVRRINFFDIVPVSFEMLTDVDGPTGGLRETLTFMVSRVELGLRLTQLPPPIIFYTNDFIFYLNGEAVDNVMSVDPGPIFFDSPEHEPIDFIPLTPDLLQVPPFSYDFTFDLVVGQAHPDTEWTQITGGAMQFPKLDPHDLEITFSEFLLFGLMGNTSERREMVDWLNEWLGGTGTATNSTVEIFQLGSDILRMEYRNVVPVSYVPFPVDITERDNWVHETLVLRAGIIEARH